MFWVGGEGPGLKVCKGDGIGFGRWVGVGVGSVTVAFFV